MVEATLLGLWYFIIIAALGKNTASSYAAVPSSGKWDERSSSLTQTD